MQGGEGGGHERVNEEGSSRAMSSGFNHQCSPGETMNREKSQPSVWMRSEARGSNKKSTQKQEKERLLVVEAATMPGRGRQWQLEQGSSGNSSVLPRAWDVSGRSWLVLCWAAGPGGGCYDEMSLVAAPEAREREGVQTGMAEG